MSTLQFTSSSPADVLAIFEELNGKPGPERRTSLRTPFQATLLATPLTTPYARGVQVFTRDISTQGLGGISRIPLVVGHTFAIPVALSANCHKLLKCRVVFSRTVRGGMYEVGMHFEEAIDGPVGLTSIPEHWVDAKV